MENKKVLVIDDEDFIRELVKDFLELESIQCDGAESSEKGLELLQGNHYNLILLDRNLGKSRAEDVIAQVRDMDKSTPIVILTGDADCDSDYQEKIGADGVIFKPFQVMEFMQKVTEFLEK